MTADDVFSMPRDLLVALVVAQDERINALVAAIPIVDTIPVVDTLPLIR